MWGEFEAYLHWLCVDLRPQRLAPVIKIYPEGQLSEFNRSEMPLQLQNFRS